MNIHSKQAHKRRRRLQSFGVFLLVLMHVVQPLMALSQTGCAFAIGGDGKDRADACCCFEDTVFESTALEGAALEQSDLGTQAVSAATEQDCCSADDGESAAVPDLEGDSGAGIQMVGAECACSMDSRPDAPADAPTNFLLQGELGEVALDEWVHAHAALFAGFSSGHPHLGIPPNVMDVAVTASTPQAMAFGALQAHPGGVISWALVVRGVGGFLATLSVFRN